MEGLLGQRVRCSDIRMHLPNIVVNTVDHFVVNDVD